eukprot:RCo020799
MVKFGRYLVEAAEQLGIPEEEFLDYKLLKKRGIRQMIEMKQAEGSTRTEQSYAFQELLEEQVLKLQSFIGAKVTQLQANVAALKDRYKSDSASSAPGAGRSEEYLEAADRLSEEYVRLSSYLAVNRLATRKITKKHDKHALLAFHELFPGFAAKLSALLPTSFFDTHVLALSDFYAEIRGENVIRSVDLGTTFDRQSIKYWVHPQDAMTVIMIIIRHLPVYTFKPEDAGASYHRKCI